MRGQCDNGNLRGFFIRLQTPRRLPPVEDRHVQVHEDNVRRIDRDRRNRLRAILGDRDFKSLDQLKAHLEHVNVVLIVLDVQNPAHDKPRQRYLRGHAQDRLLWRRAVDVPRSSRLWTIPSFAMIAREYPARREVHHTRVWMKTALSTTAPRAVRMRPAATALA